MPTYFKPLRRKIGLAVAIAVFALCVDYVGYETRMKHTARAVSELGGRIGSLASWPFGGEYRASFHRVLNSDELDRLVELNYLRGKAAVAFIDCQLSVEESRETRSKLWNCFVFRVAYGKTYQLTDEDPLPAMN